MRAPVVADTGPLYALVDRDDAWHARVIAWWQKQSHPVVVPVTVLPEVTYLIQKRIGVRAENAFVRSVADGDFTVEPLEGEDLVRVADLMQRYGDYPLGFVDATVVAVAERLEAREILTTDRRHFGGVRLRHAREIALVP